MRSSRTADEWDAGRRLAVQRVEDAWAQRQVAAFLGVHLVTVAEWVARFRATGPTARPPRRPPGGLGS